MSYARTIYNPASIGGVLMAEAVDHILKANETLIRIHALADVLTTGGAASTQPAPNVTSLEGGPEFGVATGSGQAFYSAVAGLAAALAAIDSALLASVDMGSSS